jgi:hypothetical protein
MKPENYDAITAAFQQMRLLHSCSLKLKAQAVTLREAAKALECQAAELLGEIGPHLDMVEKAVKP